MTNNVISAQNPTSSETRNPKLLTSSIITVLQTDYPCNKRFSKAADGMITKQAGIPVSSSLAWSVFIPDALAMAELIKAISNEENLLLIFSYAPGSEPLIPSNFQPGQPVWGESYRILSSKKLAEALGIKDTSDDRIKGWHEINGERVLARLKVNFAPSCWMFLDRDETEGLPDHLRTPPGDFSAWWEQMKSICPAFDGAEVLFYMSASARVYDQNKPVSSKSGFHALVQIDDPSDMERFGVQLLAHALVKGHGFPRPIRDRKTRQVKAHRAWSVFDPTVFSTERIAYDGKPVVSDGLIVIDQTIYRIPGRTVDTSKLADISGQENEMLRKEFGLTIVTEHDARSGRASFITQDDRHLRLDTIVETQEGSLSIRDYWLSQKDHVRIQAPFRNSDSWNGFLGRFSDGSPFAFDNGVRVRHVLVDEDSAGPDPEAFLENMFNHIPDIADWPAYLENVASSIARHNKSSAYADLVAQRIRDKSDRKITVASVKQLIKQARRQHKRSHSADSHSVLDVPYSIVEDFLRSRYTKKGKAHLISTEDQSFWHYIGTHWALVPDIILRSQLLEFIQMQHSSILAQYTAINGVNARVPEIDRILNSAFSLLGPKTAKGGDPLHRRDEPRPVFNCSNGTLFFGDTGVELRPHDPDDGLTSCSGIAYEPGAKAPIYDYLLYQTMRVMTRDAAGQEIVDVQETRERVRHIEEILGYAIQPRREVRSWVLLHGAGSNGKSKLVDLAVRIVGNEAVMADRIDEIEGSVFKIGDLFAKLMLIDDDVAAGIALPDGLLKKLSERKLMRGQYKHKNPFGFISTALPILLSNSWPRCRDLSLGMRSRAEIITFERIFKKPSECAPDDPDRQRPDLWERVYAEEMSGVLNRLIAGYYRVRARGAFAPPRSCQEARAIWIGEANTLARFVREQCEDAPGHRTDLTNLFVNYRMWAWRENIPSNRMASRYSLKSSLQDLGYYIIRSNSASSIVEDLRLKPQEGLPVV